MKCIQTSLREDVQSLEVTHSAKLDPKAYQVYDTALVMDHQMVENM